jgi:ABC-2 type transport system permease protein
MNFLQNNSVAFWTIVVKEVLRFSRIWVQTIVPPAVNAFLYMIIFGTLIGSQVADMEGYSYIDYIVPGIIMMTVITNAYGNVVSSFYSAKFHHSIEEILISPVHNVVILAGFVVGGVLRGITVGLAVAIVSMLFTNLSITSFFHTFFIMVLTATVFSIAGFINAIYADSFDDITIVPSFVLTPLTYLGGIFYSIHMLPSFWKTVSLANPVLYMINGFRFGILGRSDINIGLAYAVILSFIFIFGFWAMRLLNKGVGIKN